jgi:pilus assembly protein CpaE
LADLTSGQTLRLLVVSTREQLRDEVGEALADWPGERRLFWVSQPDLAPARALDLVRQVILVDDGLGSANLMGLIKQLVVRLPGAAVLALVDEQAIGEARQAVLAGARGFVTKPLQAGDLVSSLRQTLALRQAPPQPAQAAERAAGRVIVFCAPKGGTGRTILALNTAVALHHETKQPVVLVDADYASPALDVAMNLHSEHSVVDLLPRLGRLDEDLVSSVLAGHVSGVRVLLAPPPADLTSPISLSQVQQILVILKHMFPWVVVDLGIGFDEAALGFLDSADRAVVSVLPEMVGLRNTGLLLQELQKRGYGQDRIWLVLNRADLHGGVGRRDIEGQLHLKFRHTVPDDQPLATHSINRGVPLVMSHRRSAVARAVRQLAQQLAEELPVAHAELMADGLMKRWLAASPR